MLFGRKKGFTLVEIIFSIVIFGIVSVIGGEILTKMYDAYLYSTNIDKLHYKAQIALEQISKRLSFAILGSIITKNKKDDTDIMLLSSSDKQTNIIEWIGYNIEGFKGSLNTPGWSGFIDILHPKTDRYQVKTQGSHLEFVKKIVNALSYEKIDLSSDDSSAAIIFDDFLNQTDVKEFGWNDWSGDIHHKYIYRVKMIDEDLLGFIENYPNKIYERYHLVWSAYALVLEKKKLTLYYNFRPWMKDRYSDGYRSTLVDGVVYFGVNKIDNAIKIKLCLRDFLLNDVNITICQNRIVF